MIRHTQPAIRTTSQLRFYNEDTQDPFAQYCAICTLVWQEYGRVAWIEGFHGSLTRKHIRELAAFLVGSGIEEIRAFRAPDRLLPLSTTRADGCRIIKTSDIARRLDIEELEEDQARIARAMLLSFGDDDGELLRMSQELQTRIDAIRERDELAQACPQTSATHKQNNRI